MMRISLKTISISALALLLAAPALLGQTADQWRQDIDTLVGLIERHHPKPWARISQKDFLGQVEDIKAKLALWPAEKITVEVMRIAAGLCDGHTQVLLNGQERFNRWFPVRMEKFHDGIFITACDESHRELVGARVLRLGRLAASDAYKKVAAITAKDSEAAASRLTTNYLSNAVVLKALDIVDDPKELPLEVVTAGNDRIKTALASDPWAMRNNWSYNLAAAPTRKKTITVFDGRSAGLPPYLSRMLPARIPYWFEFYPDRKLLFLQFNAVTSWNREPFADFTKKLFKSYDDNAGRIDKFVIDLRFNEGGNGYLLPPLVQEFIVRRDSLPRGKLYIITGRRTFSAAPNFIGKMLKHTSAITVGDIAPGPLNWCSDTLDARLQHSRLSVQVSTMFWMEGHPMDTRGCYPPDCYLPETFEGLASFADRPLEAILSGEARPLKDILLEQGWTAFKAELDKKKALYPDVESWFPYTHFDLVLTSYLNLLPAGKKADALEVAKLNAALFPREFRTWYGLAEVARGAEETDLAIDAYEKLLKLEPRIADARSAYRLLVLLKSFRDGGVKDLAAKFRKMREDEPGELNEDTLNFAGYELLQKGKAKEAVQVFTLNVELFPQYANGHDSLGEACLRAGDKEQARKAYEKALALDPTLDSAKRALEELNKR